MSYVAAIDAAVHRTAAPLLAGALLMLFTTASCDSSGPTEEPPPCETFEGCSTLKGISQVLAGNLRVNDAVADDTLLYVALTSLTTRFDPSDRAPDEVYVLSKRLGSDGGTDPDSTWRMEQISHSPETKSGGQHGAPTLALDPDGQVHILWGELAPFGGKVTPDKIMYVTGRRGSWSTPQLAYDIPIRPDHISSGSLPAPMARGPDGRLQAAFHSSSSQNRGRVKIMKLQPGDMWSAPHSPVENATAKPDLASTSGGTLLLSYLRQGITFEDNPTGLFFAKSTDGGRTWSESTQLMPAGNTNDSPFYKVGDSQVIEGMPGTYHVLFGYDLGSDEADGEDPFSDQVWHSYSTDEGQTWSEPQPVNPSDRGSVFPVEVAATPGGQVHVIYYQSPTFASPTGNRLRHAVWSGQSWQQQPNITDADIPYSGKEALGLATDPSGCLHLVWEEIVKGNDDPTQSTRLRYRRVCS